MCPNLGLNGVLLALLLAETRVNGVNVLHPSRLCNIVAGQKRDNGARSLKLLQKINTQRPDRVRAAFGTFGFFRQSLTRDISRTGRCSQSPFLRPGPTESLESGNVVEGSRKRDC